jgi:hypothetical protein
VVRRGLAVGRKLIVVLVDTRTTSLMERTKGVQLPIQDLIPQTPPFALPELL